MPPDRINTRLPVQLAEHVARMVGEDGAYETPSEYIRDLIRRDMAQRAAKHVEDALREGHQDIAAGRVFRSSGDFHRDMATLADKERNDWRT